MKHKILDLYSGIGGFSYGFEMANLGETIAFVEKDEFCQKVLRKHWKDVPIIDDIRKVNGKDFGSATIISGGFPCQPFSVAGKRKGKDDDRYLWDETIRVVAECKPKWFIGENVDGIVNISNGKILQQIQEDLEKEGFQVQCLVIPASGIGAWHQRKRVWIIGHNVSHTECLGFSERGSIRGLHKKESNNSYNFSDKSKTRTEKRNVPNTIGELSDGCSSNTRLSKTELKGLDSNEEKDRNKVRSETERCGEQTKSWWEIECKLRGVPNGVSFELHSDRANRIKALGNSIVPQIAKLIGESILKAEDDEKQTHRQILGD